jgi:hypothetical protein
MSGPYYKMYDELAQRNILYCIGADSPHYWRVFICGRPLYRETQLIYLLNNLKHQNGGNRGFCLPRTSRVNLGKKNS